MTDVRTLTWSLDFKDNVSAGIEKADSKVDSFKKKMEGASGSMQKMGKGLSKWVTAPLAAVGAAGVKTVTGFDDGMSRVKSVSGATAQEFDALREKAIQLGNDTAYSASDAAEGMQILAASGMAANDIIQTSGEMFTLMSAGSTDADTAASILTNTMSQFNMEATESGRIADVFAQGSADAKVGVEDLEYALGMAGASMANMNMDIEQSTAMVGHFANAGVPVQQVGTMINAMSADIKANAKEFKAHGVKVYDSAGKMRDMGSIMGDLEGKLQGMTDAQRDSTLAALFSGQAQRGANAFLQEGKAAYDELTEGMYGAAGAADKMADINEDNIGGAFRSLGSSIETLMIKVGDVLKGPVQNAAEFVSGLADKFSNLDKSTQETIVKFGAIAAAVGPVLIIGGKLLSGLGKLPGRLKGVKAGLGVLKGAFNPWTLGIGALLVAGVLIYKNWDTIQAKAVELKGKVTEAWNGLKESVTGRIEEMQEKWEGFKTRMSEAITGRVEAVKDKFDSTVTGAKEGWNSLKSNLSEAVRGRIDAVKEGFQNGVTGVQEKWHEVKSTVQEKVTGTVDAITTSFSDKVSSARTAWGNLKSNLASAISGRVNAVTDSFERKIDQIREKWQNLKNFLRNPIQGTVNLARKGANWVGSKLSGSHRTGKDYIPYNGYIGELHKGEMVLTKSAAEEFRASGGTKDHVPTSQPTVVTHKIGSEEGTSRTVEEVNNIAGTNKSKTITMSPSIHVTVEGNADEGTAKDIAKEVQRVVAVELNKIFTKLTLQGV